MRMFALYASTMLLLTASIGPSLAGEWSFKFFTMTYRNGLSTVRSTTYGPFASKAECEKAKEGADWEQWHNVPGTGPTIEEKELYCQYRPNDVICHGTTKITPPTD